MNEFRFAFREYSFFARSSGALWWPSEATLIVSDLHLGKAERMARRGGPLLPPYEITETLDRLIAEIDMTGAKRIICLGDSFDDLSAAKAATEAVSERLSPVMAGRQWVWIEGNHDPGPVELGGDHLAEFKLGTLTFRHIADASLEGEISGHYHPKARVVARGRAITRPCFLVDSRRILLPAFGTYTGGLHSHEDTLSDLMQCDAVAILMAHPPIRIPMPRSKKAREQSS